MPKKKQVENKSAEEILTDEREACLSDTKIAECIKYLPDPTYKFNVGDFVNFGAMNSSVVEMVIANGKAYILKCNATSSNYGKPYDYDTYRLAGWTSVRPKQKCDTQFTNAESPRLYFCNSTVEGLIHKCYHFGVDMEPEYQRGFVWDISDKELLLDSIFDGIDIGKFVFVTLSDDEWAERELSYEILDGKQRLSTLKDFYENRFAYRGKFYNDLSGNDRRTFLEHHVSYAEINEPDRKEAYKHFLMLNRCGKKMDKAQLDKVQRLIDDK